MKTFILCNEANMSSLHFRASMMIKTFFIFVFMLKSASSNVPENLQLPPNILKSPAVCLEQMVGGILPRLHFNFVLLS